MDLDDLEPRKSADYEIGGDLTKLSVEELKGLIGKLRDEISRIEQALGEKQSQLSAADSVFKSWAASIARKSRAFRRRRFKVWLA